MRIILLLLLASLTVEAATYYVDPVSGLANANGTSQGTAWIRLPGTVGSSDVGWVTINNGDTIYVKGGSTNNVQVLIDSAHYNGSAAFDSIQIASGDAIAWGSGRAIFDGQNTRLYGFAIGTGGTGVTLKRLEIRQIADGANAFAGNGSACIEMGNTTVKVTNCKITDCYLHHSFGTTTDHGFGVEWYADPSFSPCTCIIERNVIENVRTKGVEVYGTNNLIRNNYITKTGDHGIVGSGTNCDFYNNVINMVPPDNGVAEVNGTFVHNPVYSLKLNYDNNDVFNNLAYAGTGANNAQGFASHGKHNRFFENTAYGFTQPANFGDNGANGFNIGFERTAGNNQSDNEVRNNIAAFCVPSTGNGQFFFYDQSTNLVVSYNDFYSAAGSQIATWYNGSTLQLTLAQLNGGSFGNSITAANNLATDPIFTGGVFPSGLDANFLPNTSYFALTTTSPASGNSLSSLSANGAQASSKFSTDILGVTRTIWSMGAYEYVPPTANITQLNVGTLIIR